MKDQSDRMGWYNDLNWAAEHFENSYSPGKGRRMDGSGYYETGARKCSVCQEMKTKKDFNAEEAAKPASKRCCNECGAGLPKDLSKTTVVQLKAELTKRGLPVTGLKVSFAVSSIVSPMFLRARISA